MSKHSRRSFLTAAAAAPIAAGAGLALGHCGTCGVKTSKALASKAFYKADGAFNPEVAKKAYLDMLKAFHCPIYDVLKTDQFWTCDFQQRDFAKLGMGGIFWINESNTYGGSGAKAYKGKYKDQRFGYLGHEIYLLPGQMLPEHSHIGGPKDHAPKMEAWQVRYGTVTFFGEYKGDDEIAIAKMPAKDRPWGCGQKWFKSKYAATRKAGQMYKLGDPESWHFQRAGAQGAIVTEYATFHNHVHFSKPGLEFASSKAKTV